MSPGPRSAETKAKIGASVRAAIQRKREGTQEPEHEELEEDEEPGEDGDLPMYRCACGALIQLVSVQQLSGTAIPCVCGRFNQVGVTPKVRT